MSQDRLRALEETVTHQAAAIDDLSDIVRAQTAVIDRLERRVALLMARAAEAEADAGGSVTIADQRPPHY